MKRFWILVLLLSVGLNLAFAWAVVIRGADGVGSCATEQLPFADQISPTDSVGWWCAMEQRSRGVSRQMGLGPQHAREFYRERMASLPRLRHLRMDVVSARGRLLEACTRPELEPAVVREVAAEMSRTQSRLDSLVIETVIREMSTLSPEQRACYLSQMNMHRWDRRGPGHGPQRGPRHGRGRPGGRSYQQ